MPLSSLWFWWGSCGSRTWDIFQTCVEMQNKHSISNLTKTPKGNVGAKIPCCWNLVAKEEVRLRARSCWFESTVSTEVLHIGKKLPLASPDLLQWVPLVRRMGPSQVKAVSDRQMWVIINSRQSHFGLEFKASNHRKLGSCAAGKPDRQKVCFLWLEPYCRASNGWASSNGD